MINRKIFCKSGPSFSPLSALPALPLTRNRKFGSAPDLTKEANSVPQYSLADGEGLIPHLSALPALPLTRNRKLGPPKHDRLDPPMTLRSTSTEQVVKVI